MGLDQPRQLGLNLIGANQVALADDQKGHTHPTGRQAQLRGHGQHPVGILARGDLDQGDVQLRTVLLLERRQHRLQHVVTVAAGVHPEHQRVDDRLRRFTRLGARRASGRAGRESQPEQYQY